MSSGERSVRSPGIDSSLSSVPPVCPSPRPESFATQSPSAAASGANNSVTPSATPPVECLSTVGPRPHCDPSPVSPPENRSVSPESTIAFVRARVSSSSRPRSSDAIRNAEASASEISPARVSLDERANVVGRQSLAVPLRGHDRPRISHARSTDRGDPRGPAEPNLSSRSSSPVAFGLTVDREDRGGRHQLDPSMPMRSTKLDPSSPPPSAPRSSATVCPRSEKESLVPRSWGPPSRPAARSGVRSRE